jgi:hypothetical protein
MYAASGKSSKISLCKNVGERQPESDERQLLSGYGKICVVTVMACVVFRRVLPPVF